MIKKELGIKKAGEPCINFKLFPLILLLNNLKPVKTIYELI